MSTAPFRNSRSSRYGNPRFQTKPAMIPDLKRNLQSLEHFMRGGQSDEDIESGIDKCSYMINRLNHLRTLLDRKARGDFEEIENLF